MAQPEWKNRFLPTLTHALWVLPEPFKHYRQQVPEFLAIVQEVFNISFPLVAFAVKDTDKIVIEVCATHILHNISTNTLQLEPQACKQMRTWRSLIASHARNTIQKMFNN
jgi:hypothetical protein